jgi:trigger factor
VRETLLLEAVAEHQEIEVSDEEVEEKIEQIARDQGLAPARLRQRYEDQGALPGLRGQLAEEKALEFLLAMAKVEETTGT